MSLEDRKSALSHLRGRFFKVKCKKTGSYRNLFDKNTLIYGEECAADIFQKALVTPGPTMGFKNLRCFYSIKPSKVAVFHKKTLQVFKDL